MKRSKKRKPNPKRRAGKSRPRKATRRATRPGARRAKPKRRASAKPARKKPKRRAPKRAARKKATRRVPKRAAGKKPRRLAPKRTARKKVAPKRSASRGKPARARLALVPRRKIAKPAAKRTARTAPAATAPAGAKGRSGKERILLELLRSRAVLHSAISGLSADQAEQSTAPAKWSTREIVLHLVARDLARLREMESLLRGNPASWWSYGDEEMDRDNAESLASLDHLDWEHAIEHLNATRGDLLESLESIPEQPEEVWNREHTFGRMLYGLPDHDRHHAEAIRRWRDAQGI